MPYQKKFQNYLKVLILILTLSSTTGFALVGGKEIPVPDDLVMVLNDRGGLCTGSLIAPRVVLTSAHCVININKSIIYYKDKQNQNIFIPVLKSVKHPDYIDDAFKRRKPSIDLALLYTEKDLPGKTFKVLALDHPRKGTQLQLMGFGQLSEEEAPKGIFRFIELPVVEPYGRGRLLVWLEGNGKQGACMGDSGGPIYYEGKNVAVIVGMSGKGKSYCGHYTQGLLLKTQKIWIDKILKQWKTQAIWE